METTHLNKRPDMEKPGRILFTMANAPSESDSSRARRMLAPFFYDPPFETNDRTERRKKSEKDEESTEERDETDHEDYEDPEEDALPIHLIAAGAEDQFVRYCTYDDWENERGEYEAGDECE